MADTTTDTAQSPRAVVERVLQCMVDIDMAGFGELWAEDGVLDVPFSSEGQPRRLEGKKAISDYLIEGQRLTPLKLESIEEVDIYETSDPEVIVAEFYGLGSVNTTGGKYRTRYLGLVRVRNGEIVLYRHYSEPVEWLIAASAK
ncbi:hypothetical protein SAMN05443665_104069 [Actinomadura meyerae]|jgi:ketosteroid isomerase-like protein|uniref:SnoaL-like domain-containing protein n=1 Tax=Actinomadura meyerae TaxID=240840 RepID=A0A239NGR7_9ACTN|nr:nuclear transport factor 2 family protein [Actinomadura meyerae]SNT53732.1 hypothetical protein SAMN05443665_104069 [Actinomadura meyerae]